MLRRLDMKKLKVLVVEDDADILDLYKGAFEKEARLEGRFTTDGGHAAGLLRSEAYDAAIIDIKLPNMNGLQVGAVARASEVNRRIPIFIISGHIDEQARMRAASLGAIKVIEKPFEPSAIINMLLEAVARQKPAASYDARIINALLKGISEVLEFYYGAAPQFGKPSVRQQQQSKGRAGGVTGLIGLAGETFAGSLGIVSDQSFIQGLAIKVFQNDGVQLDQEMIADLMGEMCNQVCGRLKVAFGELGIKSNIGLPEVVMGENHVVVHKVQSPVLCVPLKIAESALEVELCLIPRSSSFAVDESKAETAVSGVLLFD
jgi:DNA-binding response OmpR family regulator